MRKLSIVGGHGWQLETGDGVVCTDCSRIGKRAGDSGPAMFSTSIWRWENSAIHPTVMFTECGPDWEPKIAAEPLPLHEHHSCRLSPELVGDCYHRPRLMTTSLDQAEELQ